MLEAAQLIDTLFAIVLAGGMWILNYLSSELKRITILLNQTRENYATKMELRDDINRVMEVLHRLEDKMDKLVGK